MCADPECKEHIGEVVKKKITVLFKKFSRPNFILTKHQTILVAVLQGAGHLIGRQFHTCRFSAINPRLRLYGTCGEID